MALNSVLSLGYYAPLVNALYRRETPESTLNASRSSILILLPIILLGILVIAIGFYPPMVSWLSNLAGESLVSLLRF
jgi:NADH:ubiquinone oxidoreductase subunit 2 (subunit N)